MTPVFPFRAGRKRRGARPQICMQGGFFRTRRKEPPRGADYSASGPVMTPVTAEAAATTGLAR